MGKNLYYQIKQYLPYFYNLLIGLIDLGRWLEDHLTHLELLDSVVLKYLVVLVQLIAHQTLHSVLNNKI
mgnify:CR=1 FL=1